MPGNSEKGCQSEAINYKKVNAGKALKQKNGSRGLRGNTLRLS
ncbi:hypothetical protein [Nostoc sp. KVJ3]|nr:hypothetical protein [Nostoc sp. KVJ3]